MPLTSRGSGRRARLFRAAGTSKGTLGDSAPGACIQHPLPLPGPRTVSNEHEKQWMVVDTVMTPQTAVTKKQERQRVVVSLNVARSHCVACLVPSFFFSLK